MADGLINGSRAFCGAVRPLAANSAVFQYLLVTFWCEILASKLGVWGPCFSSQRASSLAPCLVLPKMNYASTFCFEKAKFYQSGRL